MAKIRTSRTKKAPEGFDDIKPTLESFEERLKDAQSVALHKTGRKSESLWEIFRITHERSRYVYDLHYKKKAISKDLYEWLLKQRYADANLIAKWKKQGYENLCCIKCIQGTENNNGGTCICRVPKATLEKNEKFTFKECINCGCRGCASSD
ncbi:CYFA0S16e02058g1_1 [Cyberlindnera fabianii]|uniref:CYFA0S16e02058g1_1 n=1 Tax=Cyberlindnera fabianii TaxID=36022 RepID=A0A061B6T6_CYBFA|nr:CYFA0S16e02058g1_1 [Cyberlindnera fabianii]